MCYLRLDANKYKTKQRLGYQGKRGFLVVKQEARLGVLLQKHMQSEK